MVTCRGQDGGCLRSRLGRTCRDHASNERAEHGSLIQFLTTLAGGEGKHHTTAIPRAVIFFSFLPALSPAPSRYHNVQQHKKNKRRRKSVVHIRR